MNTSRTSPIKSEYESKQISKESDDCAKQSKHSQNNSDDEELGEQISSNKKQINGLLTVKSPYFDEYKAAFIRNRRSQNYLHYWKNFIHYDIISFKQLNQKFKFKQKIVYRSKNYRILHYKVQVSYFTIKIKILNLSSNDKFNFPFEYQINKGSFGTVYAVNQLQKKSAVKEIRFESVSSLKKIQEAVKQYAFMKLMASLECGPSLNGIFGFDLVVTEKCIYFGSQQCESLSDYIKTLSSIESLNQQFQQLQLSLMLMHEQYICHCDIKSFNIMYSPSLQKLVFIDFGFTQLIPVQIGYMNYSRAKGSFHYCCDDMKKLFVSPNEKALIDVYYNDYYGLMKTKEIFLNMFKIQQNQIRSLNDKESIKNSNRKDENNQVSNRKQEQQSQLLQFQLYYSPDDFVKELINYETQSFPTIKICKQADYFTTFVCNLIVECKADELCEFLGTHKELYLKIDQNLEKIYWAFLQIKSSFKLHNTYRKFKYFLCKKHFLSTNSIEIFQSILDPYFKNALNCTQQSSEPYNQYQNDQQSNHKIFKKRYQISEDEVNNISQDLIPKTNQSNNYNFSNGFPDFILQEKKQNNGFTEVHKQSYEQQQSLRRMSLYNLPEQLLKQKFKISYNEFPISTESLKFSIREKPKIIDQICTNLNSVAFNKMLQKIRLQLSNQKMFEISLEESISVFRECFKIAYVEIDDYEYKNGLIGTKEYFIMNLNVLVELFIEFIERFNLQKAVLCLVKTSTSKTIDVIRLFKLYMKRENPLIDLSQYHIRLVQNVQFFNITSLLNFQKCLETFIDIYSLYLVNNPYRVRFRIDSFVSKLSLRIIEILKYMELFNNKMCETGLCRIFITFFQHIFMFIFQIGLNMLFEAEVKKDYSRMAFYYIKMFKIDDYRKATPISNQIIQLILSQVSIMMYAKEICTLLLCTTTVSGRLSQKYDILDKIERITYFFQIKQFSFYYEHVRILNTILFWIRFNRLCTQNKFCMALEKVDEIIMEGSWISKDQIIENLVKLYRLVGNDTKLKQIYKLAGTFKIRNIQNLEMRVKSQKKRIQKARDKMKQKDSLKTNEIPYSLNYLNLQNLDIKSAGNVNDQHRLSFNRIVKEDSFELSKNDKQYKLLAIIRQSIASYINEDKNLSYYVQSFEEYLDQAQDQIISKVKLLRNIQLSIPMYSFLRLKMKKYDKKRFNQTWVNSSVKQLRRSMEEKKSNPIQQIQFWQEIIRQEVFQSRSKLIFCLLNNQTRIKDPNIIRKTWIKLKRKIECLYKGTQKQSLTYLELASRVKQYEYRCLLQDTKISSVDKIESSKMWIQSLSNYLNQWNKNNELFTYEIKRSVFGVDLLLKVFDGLIQIDGSSKQQIKHKLIEYFFMFIENDQIYQFFTQNPILDSLMITLISFSIEEIYEKRAKTVPNSQLDQKIIESSLTQQISQDQSSLLLYKILFEFGKYTAKYPCPNYNIFLVRLSDHMSSKILAKFIEVSQNQQENIFNKEFRYFEATFLLLLKVLGRLIRKKQYYYLFLVVIKFICSMLEFFNDQIQCSKSIQDRKSQLYQFKFIYLRKLIELGFIDFFNLQTTAKVYSIELLCKITTLFGQKNQLDRRRNVFYEMKYFRNYKNAQEFNDIESQSVYLTKIELNSPSQNEIYSNFFSKKFKKITQMLNKKSIQIGIQKLISKIREKIVKRLIISVGNNKQRP